MSRDQHNPSPHDEQPPMTGPVSTGAAPWGTTTPEGSRAPIDPAPTH